MPPFGPMCLTHTDKSVADPGLPRGGHPSDFLHFDAVFRKIGRIIVWRPWIRHWNMLIVKKRGLINLTLVQDRVRYAVYALERFSVAHTPHIDNIYSGGSKGARGMRAPHWESKFFQFHAVFGNIWQNRMSAPPPRELAPGLASKTLQCRSATVFLI